MCVGWKFSVQCGVAKGAKFSRAWRGEFGNETAKRGKIQWHGNKFQCNEFSVASACGRNGQSENGAVFGRRTSLSLSLSRCSHLWHAFGLNLKGFFTHFIVVLIHLFTHKRYFLGHCAFLKFLNALFLGFCALFVILSLCKKATQRVARRKPQQKNPHKLKENLLFLDTSLALSMTANASLRAVFTKTAWQSINSALFLLFGLPRSPCSLAMTDKENALCYFTMTADFVILSVAKNPKNLRYALFMDTSLTLSMTNSGFCLKITDIFTQNSKHFTNSIHFINSTHFINLTQILSPTQGFFIFLPQIFYIFTQIAFKILKNSTQGVHYEQ